MCTLITNIGQLVTPFGREPMCGDKMSAVHVEEGMEILVRGGRIASVGKAGTAQSPSEVIDAEGRLVVPGVVNPHTHAVLPLLHCSGRGELPSGMWTVVDKLAGLSEEAIVHRMRGALDRAVRRGTTTVEVKCGQSGDNGGVELLALIRHLVRSSPLRVVPTLLGTLSSTESRRRADRVSSLIRETIPAVRRGRMAQFCDVACGDGAYTAEEARTILRAARGAGLRAKIHIEGEENSESERIGAKVEATSVDHLTKLSERGLLEMRRAGVVPVVLPGFCFLVGRRFPDARGMIDAGLPVALGSDFGLAGFGVESMWTVLSLAVAKTGMTVEEGIVAMTLNAAAAVELADEVGSLEPGKHADLLILSAEDYREIPHCVGRNPVEAVIVGGRIVHRA